MGVTQKIGKLGEELVATFLMKRGYRILDRNYRRPWGELDIIAEREGKIHFVEVKAVSASSTKSLEPTSFHYRSHALLKRLRVVTRETSYGNTARINNPVPRKDSYRAEDNVSTSKIKRLGRIIQTYLLHKSVSDETEWQCDVATVSIDAGNRVARVNLIEDVIL